MNYAPPPAPAGATPKKPSALVYVIATTLVILLIAIVYVGVKAKDYLIGAKVGATCKRPDDCASGSLFSAPICIADPNRGGAYCSKECAADTDCPNGLTCIAIDGVVAARGNKACGRRR